METVMELEDKAEVKTPVPVRKSKHKCYICGNEGFVYVGQEQYRCYREVCMYRDLRGLFDCELVKRICYVCGRVGETHDPRGNYKGLELYRCSNNPLCTYKFIGSGGIKVLYTDKGVCRYERKAPKDKPLQFLNSQELEELKQQELKERMAQLQNATNKPSLIELVTISLQERFYSIQELTDKFKANLGTMKAIVPYQVNKQGYKVINKYDDNKVMVYKIKDPQSEIMVEKVVIKEEVIKVEEVKKEVVIEKPKVKVPYISKYDVMVKMMREKPRTMSELMEVVQSTMVSVQAQFYWMKKKGLEVIKEGEMYSIK